MAQYRLSRSRAGFTLIEIMTVMGVAAVLLAIGLPSMQAMKQNAALNGSTQELVSILRQVQGEAMANKGGSLALHTAQYINPTTYRISSAGVSTNYSLPTGVSFNNFGTVTFAPRLGTANATNIDVAGSSITKHVVVSATGVVTIQ